MTFPLRSPAARKLGGVDADKVQFFRTAHVLPSDLAIAELMANPSYRGDALFVTAPPDQPGERPNPACLKDDDRLSLAYSVERFDSNNLVLTVHNTTDAPVWLVYSDVWHPGWRATVEGERRFVHRAALAYKAVQVPAGSSRVHFYFRQRTITYLYGLFAACSLLWLVLLAGFTLRLCRGDAPQTPLDPKWSFWTAPRPAARTTHGAGSRSLVPHAGASVRLSHQLGAAAVGAARAAPADHGGNPPATSRPGSATNGSCVSGAGALRPNTSSGARPYCGANDTQA